MEEMAVELNSTGMELPRRFEVSVELQQGPGRRDTGLAVEMGVALVFEEGVSRGGGSSGTAGQVKKLGDSSRMYAIYEYILLSSERECVNIRKPPHARSTKVARAGTDERTKNLYAKLMTTRFIEKTNLLINGWIGKI